MSGDRSFEFVTPGTVDRDFYQKGFSDEIVREEQVYFDVMKGIDLQPQLSNQLLFGTQDVMEIAKARKAMIDDPLGINKAVNVGASSGSAGFATVPLAYDQMVTDITMKETPLLGLIPKTVNFGMTANYFRKTEKGTATWQTEQGALTPSDQTKTQEAETIRFCRITGEVTGVADTASRHFTNAMADEVMDKTQAMNEELEDVLINGDNGTNSLEPDGLIQTISTNNNLNMSSAAVGIADIQNTVVDCFNDNGKPNLLITDANTAQNLVHQMMDIVRWDNASTMAYGLQNPTITCVGAQAPLPIVVSKFMPTGTNAKRVLIVDTRQFERRVLQDVTFEPLAKTADSQKFFLKTYMTFLNKFPEGMGMVYGIT